MIKKEISFRINLTKEERKMNLRIFEKIIEAIIVPVLVGILIGWGNFITWIIGVVWISTGIYGLFLDKEAFIIQTILILLGIRKIN